MGLDRRGFTPYGYGMDAPVLVRETTSYGRGWQLLRSRGFRAANVDVAFTSELQRAHETCELALASMAGHEQDTWSSERIRRDYRLNERHYGALTGMSKQEVKDQMGEELLQKFRRGFDKKPIGMRPDHPFWTGRDRRYQHLGPNALPTGESLRMCQERVLPYWVDNIVPAMRRGKRVLVAAHNNTLRCLVQHMDNIAIENIRDFEIPTGIPLIYRLSDEMEPIGASTASARSRRTVSARPLPREQREAASMAWGRKNTRKHTGKPDAIGFKGKFLIDAHKRDTEYLANIEALHTFKHRYDRVVSPVEGLPREDVVRECETFGIELPKAWAETKKEIGQKRREAEKAGDIVGH